MQIDAVYLIVAAIPRVYHVYDRQRSIDHYSHRAFMTNPGIGSKILFCLTYVLHLIWVQGNEPPAGVDCTGTLHPVTVDVCSASAAHPVPCT